MLPEPAPLPEYRAYYNELDQVQAQLFAGQYRRALRSLAHLESQATTRPALLQDINRVACLRAEALWGVGNHNAALVAAGAPYKDPDPARLVLQARILADLGRIDEGIDILRVGINAAPDDIRCRFWIAHLRTQRGDEVSARDAYAWFVQPDHNFLEKFRTNSDAFQDAAELTLIGRALDAWASRTSAYQSDRQLHETILSMFTRAYDVIDRTYWPAHVAAGEYLLTHGNEREAGEEFEAARQANPNDEALLIFVGRQALAQLQFDEVERILQSIRAANPTSYAADLLEVRLLNRLRNTSRAQMLARRVVDAQPENIEAWSLLAAALVRGVRDNEADEALKRIEQIDPDNARAHFEIAEQLSDLRQSEAAIKAYQIAIARAPWWTAPRNGLGEIFTRTSDEQRARVALEEAYSLDPFNVRTVNYLRVLDEMAGFEKLETDHFVFQFSPGDSPIVRGYIAPYMESIFKDVTASFQHVPPTKTVIEMFENVDSFSVRTAGLMGAETFGASFGPIITSVTPKAGSTLGPYNFARVLRHEFTHVMNMSATDQRCPRWLTEGLAVWQEGVTYRFAWLPPALYRRAMDGTLFPLGQLDKALMHPPRPTDGEVAYMESLWFVEFMLEKYGKDSIVRLLNNYRAGQGDDQAIAALTGEATADVQARFFEWCKSRVSKWGYDKNTSKAFDDLAKKADELTKAKLDADALELWRQAAALQPMSLLPDRRMAGLYIRLNRPLEAVPHLEKLLPIEIQDNRYAKRLSRLARDANLRDKAVGYATDAMYINPYDIDGHTLLAELFDAAGESEKADAERAVIKVLKEQEEAAKKSKSMDNPQAE